jgi:phosphate transport system substrate-binding protein
MSREMKSSEIDAFEKQFGYVPTEVKVAVDALAVFVHKDNPLKGLTLKQVDSVFSSTFAWAATRSTRGTSLGWAADSRAGRSRSMAATAPPAPTVLQGECAGKGDYPATVKEQPGSSSVVTGIASDLYAMGYSGIGYKTSGVNAIALSARKGEKAFEPNPENCLSGDYPLARFLYVYVNKNPNRPLDPLTREFLKFVLARQGQDVVAKDGYFPMPAALAEEVARDL